MVNQPEPQKKSQWVLTQSAFQRLLSWLDEANDSDGQRYVEIRRRLVQYFDRKNCLNGQELADETLNRVARRLEEEGEITTAAPAQFCFITARYVFLESLRRHRSHELLQENSAAKTVEDQQTEQEQEECLETCLQKLDVEDRDVIIGYYQGERQLRIANRKLLAERLSVSMNAVSIRAWRIRMKLEECVRKCLENHR